MDTARKRRPCANNWVPSIQPKADFNMNLHTYQSADVHRGFESPLLHGFHRFLIQAESQGPHQQNVSRSAVRAHHDPQYTYALILGSASFFGILGIGREDRRGAEIPPATRNTPPP